jgi:hypothetical protein
MLVEAGRGMRGTRIVIQPSRLPRATQQSSCCGHASDITGEVRDATVVLLAAPKKAKARIRRTRNTKLPGIKIKLKCAL